MKYFSLLFFYSFLFLHLPAQSVIHYWHFNTVSGIVETVEADFYSGITAPALKYEAAYPVVVNQGYMDQVAGTVINSRFDEPAGNGIRPRNPSDSMQLLIALPTTGFENIQLSYATQRSGQGMLKQVVYYTTNGTSYFPIGDTVYVLEDYQLVSFDFSAIGAVNDNADFGVKILFFEQNTAANGNNRFDNIVLEGDPLPNGNDIIHYWHFNEVSGIIDSVSADVFSSIPVPHIKYRAAYPNVIDAGYMDEVAGTVMNSRLGMPAGNGIRTRNPSDSMELVMPLPTTGFTDIILSYATQRSGQGMLKQVIYYTTDGSNYSPFGDTIYVTPDFQTVTADFGAIPGVADNPGFGVKIKFYEQNTGFNGNNRFDNVVLEGLPISNQVTGVIVLPQVLQLSPGESYAMQAQVIPASADNQNVSWQSLSPSVASVDAQGLVTAHQPGQAVVVVTTAEGGFTDSALVNVVITHDVQFYLHHNNIPVEGGQITVAGMVLLSDIAGLASATLEPGQYTVSVEADQYHPQEFDMTINSDTLIAVQLMPTAKSLIHYWHFNQLPEGIIESDQVPADLSLSTTSIPLLIYQGPGTGYLDDFGTGSSLGAQLNTPAGKALRVRNPSENKELIIELPTVNCTQVELRFDVHRSGQGMLVNHIEYTLDGITFQQDGLEPHVIGITEQYIHHVFDFSNIEGVDNNPNFAVRITWEGNTTMDNGNNRYDNIALLAHLLSPAIDIAGHPRQITVFPNPSAGRLTLQSEASISEGVYSLYDLNGRLVQSGQIVPKQNVIHLQDHLSNGVYMLGIHTEWHTEYHRVVLMR